MVHFFDLPREVRNMIYVAYVSIKGGYVLDFNSNTLKGANNESIDLAFMLTCKSVAKEMKGIAMSSNIITFSTFHSQEHQAIAGRFGVMIRTLHSKREHKWDHIHPDTLSVPEDIWRELSEAHPRFAPYVDVVKNRSNIYTVQWDNVGPAGSCGETPSVFRSFIRSALQTIAAYKHRFNVEQLGRFENGKYDFDHTPLESLVNVNPNLWTIPTLQELEKTISSMGRGPAKTVAHAWDVDWPGYKINQIKHHYSAAAVAIRFLESLSKDCRSGIRNIVLNEDRAAVAFAECHGLGFVPYCQENPHLRVQRRVSMWRTVFQTTTANVNHHVMPPNEDISLHSNDISYSVAVWILEALELKSAGMPPDSFTLTLDGDWTCSEIFHTVVQRDAAWQAAIDLCMERRILPPLSWDLRRRDSRNRRGFDGEAYGQDNSWYSFEAFPQAIQDIVAGNSIIKCNFALGEAWDVERLVEENKGRTLDDWKAAWFLREKRHFDPDPPSPNWVQLLCDNSWETVLPCSLSDEAFEESTSRYFIEPASTAQPGESFVET
ncbi:hypothetical protein CT0861_07137 [Colletotrichum tofieldiae]|uniref:Uncharacterized protein n=1 Tax=Colletotrichum tofieldiae TaxID=708197 RepID=A0A161YDI1_9PEZI|nr:hypothetical protein CT0861_07137 [Colletotrichum tofieldiae]GKT88971.1 hypothetical protein Ct61P_06821 [Colletotrichum tofieldiae]